MIHPIVHPFCMTDDQWLRLHRRELDELIERRHPAIWKLCR
jgi:hypothetical protein